MKILLINIHSTDNAGDFALMKESIRLIEENFPEPTTVILVMDELSEKINSYTQKISLYNWVFETNHVRKTRLSISRTLLLPFLTLPPLLIFRLCGHFLKWLTPESLRDLLQAYCETDAIVSIAGGYLYSSGRGTTLALKMYSLLLALILNKPVYLLPQSIGPFNKTWEKWMARIVLSRTRIIMVREPISLQVIRNCNVLAPKIRLIPDLGFGFRGVDKRVLDTWLIDHHIYIQQLPALGMTVIDWSAQSHGFLHQERYEQSCIQAASYFIEKIGGVVYIFSQVLGPTIGQDDRRISERIASGLQAYPGKVFQINLPITPEILKSIYGKMTIFLGTRMHSNIFALSEGVPLLAIGYLHKTQGIMEMLDLGYWVIDINKVEPDQLRVRLDELYCQRTEIKKHIQIKMQEIKSQLKVAGPLIYADITNLTQMGSNNE